MVFIFENKKVNYSSSSLRSFLKVAEAFDFADLLLEVDNVLAACETLLFFFFSILIPSFKFN